MGCSAPLSRTRKLVRPRPPTKSPRLSSTLASTFTISVVAWSGCCAGEGTSCARPSGRQLVTEIIADRKTRDDAHPGRRGLLNVRIKVHAARIFPPSAQRHVEMLGNHLGLEQLQPAYVRRLGAIRFFPGLRQLVPVMREDRSPGNPGEVAAA